METQNDLAAAMCELFTMTMGFEPDGGRLSAAVTQLECDLGERDPDSVGEKSERFE
jgi:hypothetical protein